jgi:hypothetical protein
MSSMAKYERCEQTRFLELIARQPKRCMEFFKKKNWKRSSARNVVIDKCAILGVELWWAAHACMTVVILPIQGPELLDFLSTYLCIVGWAPIIISLSHHHRFWLWYNFHCTISDSCSLRQHTSPRYITTISSPFFPSLYSDRRRHGY